MSGRFAARRLRSLIPLLGAAALVAVLAVAVPGTSSAFVAGLSNSTNTAASSGGCAYSFAISAFKAAAAFEYPLTEATSTTAAADSGSAGATGTYNGTRAVGSVTSSTAGGCPRDPGNSFAATAATQFVSTPTSYSSPTTFSIVVWFKTSSKNGRLLGFGDSRTGTSTNFDRMLYIGTDGSVNFGVNASGTKVADSSSDTTSANYTAAKANCADGAWHLAVANFSSSSGTSLYIDGALVDSSTTTKTAQTTTGYWRVGTDAAFTSSSGWPNAGAGWSNVFTGQLRFAAVYTANIGAASIAAIYKAGT